MNDKTQERADIIAALRCCGNTDTKRPDCEHCPLNGHMCVKKMLEGAADLLERGAEQPNDPLTLEELRGMDGEPVWCEDNTVDAGIVRLAEDWATGRLEAHFWTFDAEGNPRCYNVRLMLEMGAKFYRRKPEERQDAKSAPSAAQDTTTL